MLRNSRSANHNQYKSRITTLFTSYNDDPDPEAQAHKAKYLAVLVSGYLEQAIKELLLQYASKGDNNQLSRYIEKTWPVSKNMNVNNIKLILEQFNESWSDAFLEWINEENNRKNNINSIVRWRNSIAHGQEFNTTGVTLHSVNSSFTTIKDLVSFIENTVNS